MDPYSSPAVWHEKEEAWHEVLPGVRRRIVTHSPTGMMVYYKIDPGRVFPWHNHPHAQFGIFLEGGGTFRVGEREWRAKPGDGYFIPPGVHHELKTDGDRPSIVIDFFTPERVEYAGEAPASDPI